VQFIISQAIVATPSEFVVEDNNCFVVNVILNPMLENFSKSVNICLRYGQMYRGHFFDSQHRKGIADVREIMHGGWGSWKFESPIAP
jgi:hypothetical protein